MVCVKHRGNALCALTVVIVFLGDGRLAMYPGISQYSFNNWWSSD